jgi:flagellar L-ring protein precursor FlgH
MIARCALGAALALASALAAPQGLYHEETFRPLTADLRALRVGDVLTVLVLENASASTSADTSTEKSAGLALGVTGPSTSKSATADLSEQFNGKGRIQRSGKLLAQLTVSVVGLAPNGDLMIAGEQQIEVNEETQHIRLAGRVRPADVSEANAVLSSRIADAKITYVGEGILGEKQRPGILSRILSWLRLL